MTDQFLTRKQLESLFWRVTIQMLDLDPDLPKNAGSVRNSWQTCGAPAWKIDENVTFIRIGEQDDDFNILRDTVYQGLDKDFAQEVTAYTRVLRVHWVIYGPDSFDNAFRIRNRLYNAQFRQPLADKQIYLIPRIAAPRRMPELFNGQWWERTDLFANFNELVRSDTTVPYLKSAEVIVKSSPESGITISTDASVGEKTKLHGGV